MNKKILLGSIIAVAILVLSSLGVIAFTSEEIPFASTESSAVRGNSPRWEDEIRYYDPDELTHIIGGCWDPPCYWIWAIRLTQDELSAYGGWNITKVKIHLLCANGQTEIWGRLIIYGEGTSIHPGSIIYEDDTLYFDSTDYHFIELDTPISLDDHEELWIGIELEVTEDNYPMSIDEGPVVLGKGDWFSDDGGASWVEIKDWGLDYNWFIGAIVEGEPAELIITNVSGPIGVNAEIKNTGSVPAYNVHYTMTITGGILGLINTTVSDIVSELAPDYTIPVSSGLMFGLGPITIDIKVNASNAYDDSILKNAFIVGPFVFGIKYI